MKKTKPVKAEVQLEAEFSFAYYENAQRVAMALAMAGRLVEVHHTSFSYVVDIYTTRISEPLTPKRKKTDKKK